MSEYGLIKASTLTAIADGLREQGIAPEFRNKASDFSLYKTPNAASYEDPTPSSYSGLSSEYVETITMSEATSLRLVCNIGIYTDSSWSGTAGAGTLYIGAGGSMAKYFRKIVELPGDAGEYVVNIPANTFKVTASINGNAGISFGASIKIYALDAAGNTIQTVVPEHNSLTPEEMAEAISTFDMSKALPEEAFLITGDCSQQFRAGKWDWFLELYGDKCTTSNISALNYAFSSTKVKEIPFTLNIVKATNLSNCFNYASLLEVCPKIRGTLDTISSVIDLSNLIYCCYNLRDVEDLFEPEILDGWKDFKVTSQYSTPKPANFYSCTSLRRVPSWWYKFRLNEASTAVPNSSYTLYANTFGSCLCLDEVLAVPVWICAAPTTSNMFSNTFGLAGRLNKVTFETNDNQPIAANWKSQTIDLTNSVGYIAYSYKTKILDYNSGITADKEVKDDATYQALKNDPDWFTVDLNYSRYNHDSAVETINSLPDTSAYLASAGGSNTIKFKSTAGSLTDGGAINTLTAEEIAVAAAKGWTVTLA